METIFIGIAAILFFYLLLKLAGFLLGVFAQYILPIIVYCGVGSFFFWLLFWIFGIRRLFGISTMIIGAVLGFILWIWITFFNDNDNSGSGNHEQDVEFDRDSIHVTIDN